MKNRNIQMDIAKGLGILLVVFGHDWLVLHYNKTLFNLIYSFHLPLFFLISGVFFKSSRALKTTFLLKLDSLLKPYFVVLLFLAMLRALTPQGDFMRELFYTVYGIGPKLRWGPMWFLPHLFAVSLFAWFIIYGLHRFKSGAKVTIILLFGLLIIGVKYIHFFWLKEVDFLGNKVVLMGLPFSFDIILVTEFYFLVGYFLKDWFLHFTPSVLLSVGMLLLFILLHGIFHQTMDLNARRYDSLVIPTLEAMSGIYLTLTLAYVVVRWRFLARALAYVGSATLFILIFHTYFQIKTFSMTTNLLHQNVFVASVVSFLAGVVGPILIWNIVRKSAYLSLFLLPLRTNSRFSKYFQIVIDG